MSQPIPTLTTDGAVSVVEPYIVPFRTEHGHKGPRVKSVDDPLFTITTKNPIGLAEPFLVPMYGERPTKDPRTHSVDEPVPTIPATGGGKFGVVEPFIVPNNTNNVPRSVDEPAPAITGGNRNYLCESFIVTPGGANLRDPRATSEPLPTITGSDRFAVVEPILMHTTHGRDANRTRSADEPLPTITGANRGELALVEPFIVDAAFGEGHATRRTRSADEPLGTIPGSNRFGVAEPFITKYNGTGTAYPVTEPLDTITAKDRFGLVQPVIDGYALDIRFRMLQPHELAAATSFPKSYVFKGTREDVVKQIGNAWPGELAKALNTVVLVDHLPAKRGATRKVKVA